MYIIYVVLNKFEKAANTFSPYNINVYNELFYKYAEGKLINDLPNLFTKLDLFNIALHEKITSEVDSRVIKLKELAGGKKMDRWETFSKINKSHRWQVLLTDFDKSLLPNSVARFNTENFKFTTSICNLFDNFPKLSSTKKYDCMLSTYTFDNLWLTDDLHLTKVNNTWYKNMYKIDLSKVKKRIKDIEKGKKLEKHFFKDIEIIIKKTKIDTSSIKYGKHIDNYYKKRDNVSVNYPGGLINTIVDSFTNQLKKNGIFITADMATTDNDKKKKGFQAVFETIKIKVENYSLAKFILEKLGFQVELKNIHEFIKEAGIITPVRIHDHFVFIVTPYARHQ